MQQIINEKQSQNTNLNIEEQEVTALLQNT